MAKKSSAKPTKKPTRPVKGASSAKRGGAAAVRARRPAEKYEQSGAPWWKQHLPG